MFLPLFATLALIGQAPAAPEAPLSVLIAPPEAAGVPSHIVSFGQEHVYAHLRTQGLQVVRASELSRRLAPAKRKAVFGCNRTEPACRVTLGEAAQTEAVLIAELVQFVSGYRVGVKAYATRDGALLAEHYIPGMKEDQLLDALTQASEKVVPQVRQLLRPPPPPPVVEAPPPPPPATDKPELTAAPRSGAPSWGWAPAAGGAVLLGAGTWFLLQADKDYRTLKGETGQVTGDGRALVRSGERWQNLSRAAFVVGAAGVVTSGVIYFLSGKAEPGQVRPTAAVGNGGGMVGLTGTLP